MRPLALVALGALVLIAGCGPEPADAPLPETPSASAGIGDPAPDFTLVGIDDEPFTLSDQRGEVVVLNFWATWCLPCLAEMPALEALHQDLGEQGVRVVGVSQDTGGADEIRPLAERLGITYPLLPDPGFHVSTRYGGIPVLPTTVFIDRQGSIVRHEVGALSAPELRALVENVTTTPTR